MEYIGTQNILLDVMLADCSTIIYSDSSWKSCVTKPRVCIIGLSPTVLSYNKTLILSSALIKTFKNEQESPTVGNTVYPITETLLSMMDHGVSLVQNIIKISVIRFIILMYVYFFPKIYKTQPDKLRLIYAWINKSC